MPGFIAEHFHHSSPSDDVGSHHESGGGSFGGGLNLEGYFGNKPSHMIYCKAGGDRYCVAIRDGKVLLTYADPNDPTQVFEIFYFILSIISRNDLMAHVT